MVCWFEEARTERERERQDPGGMDDRASGETGGAEVLGMHAQPEPR
jgi:hypothetical protein